MLRLLTVLTVWCCLCPSVRGDDGCTPKPLRVGSNAWATWRERLAHFSHTRASDYRDREIWGAAELGYWLACGLYEKLGKEYPEQTYYRTMNALVRSDVAVLHVWTGKLDEAERWQNDARKRLEAVRDDAPNENLQRFHECLVHVNGIRITIGLGKFADAIVLGRRFQREIDAIPAGAVGDRKLKELQAEVWMLLATTHLRTNDLAAAVEVGTKAVELYRKFHQQTPGDDLMTYQLAFSQLSLGNVRLRQNRLADAKRWLTDAAAGFERLTRRWHGRTAFVIASVEVQHLLGAVTLDLNQPREAEKAFRAALAVTLPPDLAAADVVRYRRADCQLLLARVLASNGRNPEAVTLVKDALDGMKTICQAPDGEIYRTRRLEMLESGANVQWRLGVLRAAIRTLDTLVAAQRDELQANPADVRGRARLADAFKSLGGLRLTLRENDAADAAYTACDVEVRALLRRPGVNATMTRIVASVLAQHANIKLQIDKLADADALFVEAIELLMAYRKDRPEDTLGRDYLLGVLLDRATLAERMKRFELAGDLVEQRRTCIVEILGTAPTLAELRRYIDATARVAELRIKHKHPKAALAVAEGGIAQVEATIRKQPTLFLARVGIPTLRMVKVHALKEAGRETDAIAELLALEKVTSGMMRTQVRLLRAYCLVRLGHDTEALKLTADEVARTDLPGPGLYNAGCVYARAAALSHNAPTRTRLGDRAMELLREALADGFPDLTKFATDDDLRVLRDRADWADLIPTLPPPSQQ